MSLEWSGSDKIESNHQTEEGVSPEIFKNRLKVLLEKAKSNVHESYPNEEAHQSDLDKIKFAI